MSREGAGKDGHKDKKKLSGGTCTLQDLQHIMYTLGSKYQKPEQWVLGAFMVKENINMISY